MFSFVSIPTNTKARYFCPFLRKKGYCLKGSRCDFSHAVPRPTESQLATSDNPQRPQIQHFLRNRALQNMPTLMRRLEQPGDLGEKF